MGATESVQQIYNDVLDTKINNLQRHSGPPRALRPRKYNNITLQYTCTYIHVNIEFLEVYMF